MLHRLGNRRLGYGVEDDAADRLVLDQLLLPKHVEHVPGNSLAFAIRVGGEDQFVGVLQRVADIGEALLRLGVDFPDHGEIVVGQHRSVLGRQVADMAEAREDLIVLAEVVVDRLGLGRTFNDDELHGDSAFREWLSNGPQHGEAVWGCQPAENGHPAIPPMGEESSRSDGSMRTSGFGPPGACDTSRPASSSC